MIHRLEFRAMGCRMEAIIDSDAPPAILNDVPVWFEEWEQILSRFRIDSELSLLNRRAGQMFPVSQTLWDVFQASRQAERLTDGLVNPLILEALIHAGYERDFERLSFDSPRVFPDFETEIPSLDCVVADEATRSIYLPDGVQLDFGGIAKGWCAHRAAERLKEAGPALVNAGGDIAINGPRPNGEAWPIGVENPFQRGGEIEILYVERGGVATSGRDYRHWIRNGIPQHHIIDPRIGKPAETDILTATVVAPTAMEAEAIAKAVMISGSAAGLARLDADEDLAGLLVLENGAQLYSHNLEKYL
jgi:thiamine biosynthesis lipoprotein